MKAAKVERALAALGYRHVRTQGSHRIHEHPVTKRRTTVPFHGGGEDVPKGTIKGILEDLDIDWPAFEQLL